MVWENVNRIEKVWEAMSEIENGSTATSQRAQIFRENIKSLVAEMGGRKEFIKTTGVNDQAVSHWTTKGVTRINDDSVQALRNAGIEDPEELFILPLEQVARRSAQAEPAVETATVSPETFFIAETQERVQALLNSPVRRHFRLVVDMLYNDLKDMTPSR